MKLYSENKDYKLYQGNMLDMLEVIELNSIDSIITDPPYELNFMGKGWDNSGIAFQKETWQKCYEVLKPGGYLLAFGGSRTFHRIACAIEDAGFEIRDTIMWLYGSGFPKSMDISKQIDKRNGRTNNDFIEFGKYLSNEMNKKNITTIQLAEIGKFYANINHGGSVSNWINGKNVPTLEQYKVIKEKLNLDNRFDWLIKREEAEREVIGQRKSTAMDGYKWLGEKYEESQNNLIDITIPETDLAKQWQGRGTALKPSFEPIIVARKPFKGSLVDNVIEYGVGGINIDECRVETGDIIAKNISYKEEKQSDGWGTKKCITEPSNIGRFPANTILTYNETDFDEVCGGFPNTKSGIAVRHNSGGNTFGGNNKKPPMEDLGYIDSGSASRYFYCAKASKKDRDEGLEDFDIKGAKELLNREENSDGASWNGKYSSGNAYAGAGCPKKNTHPTVKPTELMQYLIRLVSPDGATILDCFNGSGSTGKAVMYENKERNKNYKYIGIELTEEYLPIAKARIEYVCKLNEEQLKEMQLSIFDMMEE